MMCRSGYVVLASATNSLRGRIPDVWVVAVAGTVPRLRSARKNDVGNCKKTEGASRATPRRSVGQAVRKIIDK